MRRSSGAEGWRSHEEEQEGGWGGTEDAGRIAEWKTEERAPLPSRSAAGRVVTERAGGAT